MTEYAVIVRLVRNPKLRPAKYAGSGPFTSVSILPDREKAEQQKESEQSSYKDGEQYLEREDGRLVRDSLNRPIFGWIQQIWICPLEENQP
jgi:hypothetical protein